MSPPGAGPATGEFLYEQFVENRLNEAIRLEREGLPDFALQTLAEGMHAIMDSTAPRHNGFQVWNGIDPSIVPHLAYDALIMPWELKATAAKLREYYDRFRQGAAARP